MLDLLIMTASSTVHPVMNLKNKTRWKTWAIETENCNQNWLVFWVMLIYLQKQCGPLTLLTSLYS